ncbi:hypothetical protein GQF42_26045 [Streptomyces broussonetiae]|uniref:Uncharacterized protein n=1 Tax=Streptomyces broussonetiae TaxID=2686304 RepID=A0A6I6MZJ6_9ACTN|nr:hypothetical protein [Streptomyces broussonetiae]QHA06278.1 hypothetical protein GQF42_26045 [Streptomyces broussonetiae]
MATRRLQAVPDQAVEGGGRRRWRRKRAQERPAHPGKWNATEGKLNIRTADSEFFNSACGVHDGHCHPDFPDGTPTGTPATGPAVDPYDRSKSLTDEHQRGCGAVTRT